MVSRGQSIFEKGHSLKETVLHSHFFTEWLTPYSKPELNVFTVFFSIIFLPEILINAFKHIKSRRQASD